MADDDKKPEETEATEAAAEETPEQPAAEESAEQPAEESAEQPAAEAPEVHVEGEVGIDEDVEDLEEDDDEEEPTPRVKPAIPGADLEVDIVREGEEALRGEGLYGELPPGQPLVAIRAAMSGQAKVSRKLRDAEAMLVQACLAPAGNRPPTAAAVAGALADLR